MSYPNEIFVSGANIARRQIEQKGDDVIIVRVTGAVYDPVTGQTTGGVSQNLETKGIPVEVSDDTIDGSRVQRGDKWYVLHDKVEPRMSDGFLANGQVMSIQEILPKKFQGVAIVFRVRVRK